MDGHADKPVRAGIFTYHFSDNFGALMQAYGLRTWLRLQGIDAEFVNYHPSHVEGGGRFQTPLDPQHLKANAKILYLRASALQRRLLGNKEQAGKFAAFRAEDLGVTGPRLETAAQVDAFLSEPRGRYDFLICGSDQIWAPSQQYGIDPIYYLNFPSGAQGARRVAYAPSFGKAELDAAFKAEATRHLKTFDGLSVREPSGVAIVSRLTGRDVACVPDPTILFGDYGSLASQARDIGDGHVFCYALRTGQGIREVAKAAGALTGTRVLSPYNPHRRWSEIGKTIYPSPPEWIAYTARSGYVVSNSFHGTVFGILFRKPFVTVALPGKRGSLNERSLSLLRALGLEDRFVDGSDMTKARRVLETPIDWTEAEGRLSVMQTDGRAYLAANVLQVI